MTLLTQDVFIFIIYKISWSESKYLKNYPGEAEIPFLFGYRESCYIQLIPLIVFILQIWTTYKALQPYKWTRLERNELVEGYTGCMIL